MSRFSSLAFLALAIAACGDNILLHDASITPPPSENPDARTSVVVPNVYGFESQFQSDRNSVAYDEPPHLHVLALELDLYLAGLTAAIDLGSFVPADGDVQAVLERFYDFDLAIDGRTDLVLITDPPTFQPSLDSMARGNDIGLRDLIAGNAPAGQHQDWNTAFAGWQEGGPASPDELVRYWLRRIDGLAVERAVKAVPVGPDGKPIPAAYITPQGQDLRQLIASFLIGAIDISQAIDVHLDDDVAGLGVNALNSRKGELLYSEAEHQWDLAFGYYGGAFDTAAYNDDEIAGLGGREGWSSGYHDSTGNGSIDLRYEYNHAAARLAAALDFNDPTPDRTRALFVAFLTGRAILQGSGEPMSAERRAAFIEQRDIIVRTWEQVLAETAVNALDQTLVHMGAFGTDAYDFAAHARAWSTLEGTVLSLQFSRFSPLSAEDRATLYQHLGDEPVLPDAGADAIAAYRAALTAARALLVAAYDLGS
jgi:hypothetical protein